MNAALSALCDLAAGLATAVKDAAITTAVLAGRAETTARHTAARYEHAHHRAQATRKIR